ncbi:hypothetical protein PENARI_c119G01380 [Penicillium arizonense]|uniref:Uncharacterized protein n=1 Tax=Penicillium arizonense TaxID=1835702 RepID=A0A1F5L124_PENAI|nr:hypothetical protein PENARI_c119G01380 [Penicillium arizonense]
MTLALMVTYRSD